jgi:hypothetical protein
MEHLAVTNGVDPIQFRLDNLQPQHPLPDLVQQLKEEAGYDDRVAEIAAFNSVRV